MKSIDSYFLACYIMIFIPLIECSVVALLSARAKKKKATVHHRQNKLNHESVKEQMIVHTLNRWARWVIPLGCIVYNVIYGLLAFIVSMEDKMAANATSTYYV